MKLQVQIESYNSRGGDEGTTLAAEYLAQYLAELPPVELQIVLTACFRSRSTACAIEEYISVVSALEVRDLSCQLIMISAR